MQTVSETNKDVRYMRCQRNVEQVDEMDIQSTNVRNRGKKYNHSQLNVADLHASTNETNQSSETASAGPSSTHSNRSARSSRTAAPGSAPSTPRRKGTTLPTVFEEEATRRRYRPVFADQQQWLKGDARLERELKPWTQKWRELVKSAGGDVWKAVAMA